MERKGSMHDNKGSSWNHRCQ